MTASTGHRPLGAAYYRKPCLDLARSLLGKLLLRNTGRGPVGGYIVEVEAYIGEADPACHAASGRTTRNEVMYGRSGRAYVYFTYGMHHCFNVVCGREGVPEAVLVRAIEPVFGISVMRRNRGKSIRDLDLARGPARLCKALGLDGRANGADLLKGPVFIARGRAVPRILGVSARVGISRGADKPWRFFDAESPFVSPGKPGPARRSRRSGHVS